MPRWKKALGLGGLALALVVGGVIAYPGGSTARSRSTASYAPAVVLAENQLEYGKLAEAPPPNEPLAAMAHRSSKVQKMPGSPPEVDPKLIRTGAMSIEVQEYERALKELDGLVKVAGGYIASESSEQGEHEKRRGQLQLRLPATGFEGGYSALKALGKVRSESLTVQDVSKEYVDLEARLKVKRQTAQRLEGLLGTRTAKLADVLAAEQELARVTEEIESLEGERRFYDHQVGYCTLNLTLFEPQALVEPAALSPLSRITEHTVETLASSLAFLIGSLAMAAPWLLLASLIWGLRRWLKRPATHPS